MSGVFLTGCSDYDAAQVGRAVSACFEYLASQGGAPAPGCTVVVKPNMLSTTHGPEKAVNTHPAVTEAVASHLRTVLRCRVLIGDSCGVLFPQATRKALKIAGIPDIAEKTGAEVCNFDEVPAREVELESPEILEEMLLPEPLLNADFILSLPKLKTHGLTLYTGAVKNTFGCLPGERKKRVHVIAPSPSTLSRALVDVFSAVKPNAQIMDGVVGMEGNGPAGGRPRAIGLLLASTDAVAMDAVAAELTGFKPGEIQTTASAAERGLGTASLDEIDVAGEAIEDFAVRNFRKPYLYKVVRALDMIPSWFSGGVSRWFIEMNATIDQNKCKVCGLCLKNCPVGAISKEEGRMIVDAEKCIACFCCDEVCPHGAVRIRRKGLGKILGSVSRR